MDETIARLMRDAGGFIARTTNASGDVAWFGPLRCPHYGGDVGVLFVSVEMLRDLAREDIATASQCLGMPLLETCLHAKLDALSGRVEDIDPSDPEQVATHVMTTGMPVVLRINESYRGFARLVSQQVVTAGAERVHGFILCKGQRPERGRTETLRLGMILRGCSRERGADAPVFRPLDKMLRWGPPPGRLAFVFLSPRLREVEVTTAELHLLEQGEHREDDIRFFGSFVHSEGGRIIFFPGIPRSRFGFGDVAGREVVQVEDAELDHLTLEAHGENWHITAVDPDGRRADYDSPTLQTRRLSPTLVHWFSLGAETGELFYKMARENLIETEVPETDFERRFLEARRAVHQASYNFASLGDNRREGEPAFWYFEVLVSAQRGEAVPDAAIFAVPRWMGETSLPAGTPFEVAIRRIEIPTFTGELILMATRLPGTLLTPFSVGFQVVAPH